MKRQYLRKECITVQTDAGPEMAKAIAVRGLALHRAWPPESPMRWTVTHIKTGLACGGSFRRADNARRWLRLLLSQQINWNRKAPIPLSKEKQRHSVTVIHLRAEQWVLYRDFEPETAREVEQQYGAF